MEEKVSEMNISAGDIKNGEKKKKRTAKSYALSLLCKLTVSLLLIFIIFRFVVGVNVCHDNYSYPMLKDGDLCLSLRLYSPAAGDLIVYCHEGNTRFGRIAAVEGDSVDISGECLTVNGNVLNMNTVYPTTKTGAVISFPYRVPENCIFVLNDNREKPDDSRIYGGIPLREVQGSVILLMRRRGI